MLAAGEIVPFLGAGASLVRPPDAKQVPDGKGLAAEMVKEMAAYPPGASEDLAKVAQLYQRTVFDRDDLYALLHEQFEAEQVDQPPSDIATMLAELPRGEVPLFVVTTNYNSFVERAFRTAGRPICVITQNMRNIGESAPGVQLVLPDGSATSSDSLEFQWDSSRFSRDCAFLFKMHGSVHGAPPQRDDDVIITEDDYIDFMVNLGGKTSYDFPPPALTKAYKARRFLFLGYSLHDWNFRAFLRLLGLRNAISPREERRHWSLQLNPHKIEVDLWSHRNVNVYNGDLAEFCVRLRRACRERAL